MAINTFEVITRHGWSAFENTSILGETEGFENGDFKSWDIFELEGEWANISGYGNPKHWSSTVQNDGMGVVDGFLFLNGDFSDSLFAETFESLDATNAYYSFLKPNEWVVKNFSIDNHGYDKGEEHYCEANPDCDYTYYKGDDRELYPSLDLQSSSGASFGSNIISNGDFASNITGWTVTDAATTTIAHSSGQLRIDNTAAGETSGAYATITTEIGHTYFLSVDVDINTGASGTDSNGFRVTVGTAASGSDSYSIINSDKKYGGRASALFPHHHIFKATSTTTYISLLCGEEDTTTGYVLVDDVEVRIVSSSLRKAGSDDFQYIPAAKPWVHGVSTGAVSGLDSVHISANATQMIDYGSYKGFNDLQNKIVAGDPDFWSRKITVEGAEGSSGRYIEIITDDSIISRGVAEGVAKHWDITNLSMGDYYATKLSEPLFGSAITSLYGLGVVTPLVPAVLRVGGLNQSTGGAFGGDDYVTIKTNFQFDTTHPISGAQNVLTSITDYYGNQVSYALDGATGISTPLGNGYWYPKLQPPAAPSPPLYIQDSGILKINGHPETSSITWRNDFALELGHQYRVFFDISRCDGNLSIKLINPSGITLWMGSVASLQEMDGVEPLASGFAFGVDFCPNINGASPSDQLNALALYSLELTFEGGVSDELWIDKVRFTKNSIKHALHRYANTEGGDSDAFLGGREKDFIISTYPSLSSGTAWRNMISYKDSGGHDKISHCDPDGSFEQSIPSKEILKQRRYLSRSVLFDSIKTPESQGSTFRFSPSRLAPKDSEGFFTGAAFDVTCTLRRPLGSNAVDYYADNTDTDGLALKSHCKINSIEFSTNEYSHITQESSGDDKLSFVYDPAQTFTPPPEATSTVSLFDQGLEGEVVTVSWDFTSFTGNALMIDFGSNGTNAIEVSGTAAGSQDIVCDGDNIRLRSKLATENRTYGSELVVNGTFATNLNDWLYTSTAASYVAHSSGEMHIDGLKGYTERGVVYQDITVSEGDTYILSLSYRMSAGVLSIDLDGADEFHHESQTDYYSPIDYVTFTREFVAATTTLRINFWGTTGLEVDTHVDNVSLKKVTITAPTATSAVLDYIKVAQGSAEIKMYGQKWGDASSANIGIASTYPYDSGLRIKSVSTALGSELISTPTTTFVNGDLTGWTLVNSATNTTDGAADYADVTSSASSNELIKTGAISVTVGEEYEVSFNRVSGTQSVGLYVAQTSTTGAYHVVSPTYSSTAGVEKVRFIAPATAVYIGFRASATNKKCLFDDVSLKQLRPVAAAFAGEYPEWYRNVTGLNGSKEIKIRVDVKRLSPDNKVVLTTNIGTYGNLVEHNITSTGVWTTTLAASSYTGLVPQVQGNIHQVRLRAESTANPVVAIDAVIASIEIERTNMLDESKLTYIDLYDDFDLPISLSSKDFSSISKSSGDFSKTITVPATNKNKDAILFNGELNSLINEAYREGIDCLIRNQGVDIFQGLLFLNESSLDEFGVKDLSFHIKGGNSSWAEKLKRKRLRTLISDDYSISARSILGLTETDSDNDIQFPDENYSATDNASNEIVFPLVDNGQWKVSSFADSVNEVSVGWDNIKPAYRIVKVLNQCFNSIGYTLKSDFFNGGDWSSDFGSTFLNFMENLVGVAPTASVSEEAIKASELDLSYDHSTVSGDYNSHYSNKEPSAAYVSGLLTVRPKITSPFLHETYGGDYHCDWAFLHFNKTNTDASDAHSLSDLMGDLGSRFSTNPDGSPYSKILGHVSGSKSHISVAKSGYYKLNFSVKADFNCQGDNFGTTTGSNPTSDLLDWHSGGLSNVSRKFTVGLVSSTLANDSLYRDSSSFGLEFFDLDNDSFVELDPTNYYNANISVSRTQYLKAGEIYNVMALSAVNHQGAVNFPMTLGTKFRVSSAEMNMTLSKDIAPMRGKNNLIYTPEGNPKVSYAEVLPDVSCLEFISDISKAFNLIFTTNEALREVVVEPYKDFYSNSEIKDWTDKAVITNIKENAVIKSDLKYSMASDSSDYEIDKFKSGTDDLSLGDNYVDTGIKVEADDTEISLDIYAPMKMAWSKFICRDANNTDVASHEPIWIPRIWDTPDSNLEPEANAQVPSPNNSHEHKLGVLSNFIDVGEPSETNNNTTGLTITYELERFWDSEEEEIRFKKERVKSYLPVGSYSPFDSDFPNLTFSTTIAGNANSKGLYNKYHEPLIEMLKMRDKLITAEVLLTPADLAGIDFRERIHIDGNVYILNKIKDFNFSGEPTEVELLLVTPRGTKE